MIRFLVMDVDGTLTDGKIYMSDNGELMKAFDVKDGYAIRHMLPELNILPVIITGRQSQIVKNRCRELGISRLRQAVKDKYAELCALLGEYSQKDGCNYSLANVAFIGDDIPDKECMDRIIEAGGLTACPADAVAQVKTVASLVTTRVGGDGAVREFVEFIASKVD